MPRLNPVAVQKNEFLTSALQYLEKGFVIMPIWGVRNSQCACPKGKNCDRPAKHPVPIMKGGRPTWNRVTDKERAKRIWGVKNPPNIGICTGPASNIWVLDVDAGDDKNGWYSLYELQAQIGDLPETHTVMTGSGGAHFYFMWPRSQDLNNSNRNLPPDLDVRGKGGFVVAPPSKTLKGEYFVIDEDENDLLPLAAEAPSELLEMLKPPVVQRTGGEGYKGPSSGSRDPAALDRYAESALEREVDKLRALQGAKSGWNNGVFSAACNMLEIANATWCSFSESEILALIRKNVPVPTDGKPWSAETQIKGAMDYIGSKARPEPL